MNSPYSEIKKYCDQNQVTLVAISKTKTPDEILRVYNEGQRIFGENKVQELLTKQHDLPKDILWHLVGHLQTNKVKTLIPSVSLIHSVDSTKLLEEINKEGRKNNSVVNVLLQIHIAREETKFGLSYDEAKTILINGNLNVLTHISVCGLMGMATLTDDSDQIRKEFRELKSFFYVVKQIQNPNIKLETLSMGMSSDYKIAIEEGSTMIRIGSAIFGERI